MQDENEEGKEVSEIKRSGGFPCCNFDCAIGFFLFWIVILFTLHLITKHELQKGIGNQSRFEHWMGDYIDIIGDQLFADLTIPGSHDSLTYDSSTFFASSNVDYSPGVNKFLNFLSLFYFPGAIVRALAVTQSEDIITTLNSGIRYLDLRLTYTKKTIFSRKKDWYNYHMVLSKHPVLHYMELIRQWLDTHPTEVLVISLTSRGDFSKTGEGQYQNTSKETKQDLWNKLQQLFSGYVFDSNRFNGRLYMECSLRELINAKIQIIFVTADSDEFAGGSSASYPSERVERLTYTATAIPSLEFALEEDSLFKQMSQHHSLFHRPFPLHLLRESENFQMYFSPHFPAKSLHPLWEKFFLRCYDSQILSRRTSFSREERLSFSEMSSSSTPRVRIPRASLFPPALSRHFSAPLTSRRSPMSKRHAPSSNDSSNFSSSPSSPLSRRSAYSHPSIPEDFPLFFTSQRNISTACHNMQYLLRTESTPSVVNAAWFEYVTRKFNLQIRFSLERTKPKKKLLSKSLRNLLYPFSKERYMTPLISSLPPLVVRNNNNARFFNYKYNPHKKIFLPSYYCQEYAHRHPSPLPMALLLFPSLMNTKSPSLLSLLLQNDLVVCGKKRKMEKKEPSLLLQHIYPSHLPLSHYVSSHIASHESSRLLSSLTSLVLLKKFLGGSDGVASNSHMSEKYIFAASGAVKSFARRLGFAVINNMQRSGFDLVGFQALRFVGGWGLTSKMAEYGFMNAFKLVGGRGKRRRGQRERKNWKESEDSKEENGEKEKCMARVERENCSLHSLPLPDTPHGCLCIKRSDSYVFVKVRGWQLLHDQLLKWKLDYFTRQRESLKKREEEKRKERQERQEKEDLEEKEREKSKGEEKIRDSEKERLGRLLYDKIPLSCVVSDSNLVNTLPRTLLEENELYNYYTQLIWDGATRNHLEGAHVIYVDAIRRDGYISIGNIPVSLLSEEDKHKYRIHASSLSNKALNCGYAFIPLIILLNVRRSLGQLSNSFSPVPIPKKPLQALAAMYRLEEEVYQSVHFWDQRATGRINPKFDDFPENFPLNIRPLPVTIFRKKLIHQYYEIETWRRQIISQNLKHLHQHNSPP